MVPSKGDLAIDDTFNLLISRFPIWVILSVLFQVGILMGDLYLHWSTFSLVFLILESILPLLWFLGNLFHFLIFIAI